MLLDTKSKNLSIKIDGAYFKIDSQVKNFGRGNIRIFAWKSMAVSMYDARSKKWIQYEIILPELDINFAD